MTLRKCKTCNNPNLSTIDVLLKRGEPLLGIARRYNVPYNSLIWHYKNDHHKIKTSLVVRRKDEMKRRTEPGDLDAVQELMDVVNECRRRYFILTEGEDAENVYDRHTTQCLDIWRKASVDYLEKVAKVVGKPGIQVSIVMPVLIGIVNQLPHKLRKAMYDELKRMEKQGKIFDVKIEDLTLENEK